MLNNKGFILSEVLLSMSALLVSTTIILPIVMEVKSNTQNIRYDIAATHLLYQELQGIKLGVSQPSFRTITAEGRQYEMTPLDDKICVYYMDSFKEWKRNCEKLE